jgi:hypothetical protein
MKKDATRTYCSTQPSRTWSAGTRGVGVDRRVAVDVVPLALVRRQEMDAILGSML